MPNQDHITDQLPAYVLQSLEPAEMEAVSRHLDTCKICQEHYRAYENTLAELAFSVPQVKPPPVLKRTLLQSIEASSATTRPLTQTASLPSWWQRFRQAWQTPGYALTAVAAILIMALLLSNVLLYGRVRNLQKQVAATSTMQAIMLSGSDQAPQARAMLIVSENGDRGALIVDDLPPLDVNHTYQLWLITPDGQRDSGAVFAVDEQGYATIEVNNPQPLQNYAAFGVTIEPAGGSSGPTGPKVLGGANQNG